MRLVLEPLVYHAPTSLVNSLPVLRSDSHWRFRPLSKQEVQQQQRLR